VKLRFRDFVFDSDTRQVLRGQSEVHLSPKAFDLLCALVERRPAVIDKSELVSRVWAGTFVGDANLNVLIAEIRRALGDSAHRPEFIRTVHGIGYAFCGQVTDLEPPKPGGPGGAWHRHDDPLNANVRAAAGTQGRVSTRFWLVWNERTFALTEGDNLIGRDPGCTVWLDEAGVSRRHARIRVESASRLMTLEDLHSTNGTFVGETQLSSKHSLRDGEVIQIGSATLTFRAWFPETSRETERIQRPRRR
jgi:DNA-binding winged helix-turn-helix (wHTH) protein